MLQNRFPQLQNVIQSVTLNGNQLLMTAMLGLIIIYIYALVKGKQMLGREEWSLVQQEVVSGLGELSKTYNFNETQYSNISIALQFYTKKEK